MSALTFASWTRALSARGYGVLPTSHAVPVSLWLRDGDRVLHVAYQVFPDSTAARGDNADARTERVSVQKALLRAFRGVHW